MDERTIRAKIQAIDKTLAELDEQLERGYIDFGRYTRLKTDWERQKAELEDIQRATSSSASLTGESVGLSTSLIVNPGFEEGFIGWHEDPAQFEYGGQSVEDTTQAHTGQGSRKLFLRWGGSHIIQNISFLSPLPAVTRITLRAWVKMPYPGSRSNKWFTLQLIAASADGREDSETIDQFRALPHWSQLSVGPLVTKFPVTRLEIHAMTSKGDGSYSGFDRPVWVDDFELDIANTFGQENSMTGIPSDLYSQLRQALLDCGPFDSNRQLRNIFAHSWLRPFRHNLPEADRFAERVEAIIAFLVEKRRADTKENALVLLLRVLTERLDPADECHPRLAGLADELERALGGGTPASSLTPEADLTGGSWNTSTVRALLSAAFSDGELTTLCFDHFRSVYEDLSSGMSKGQKIQHLLDHCTRHDQLEDLVSLVREYNPTQYARFEGCLRD